MGDVVNLRLVRKRKSRDVAAEAADNNRVRFGVSRRKREMAAAERDMTTARLDRHRLEGDPTVGAETPDAG